MARKKKEKLSKQEQEIRRNERRVTLIAALFFIMMIVAGLMLSMTNVCGWYTEDELHPSASDAQPADDGGSTFEF